MSHTSHLRNHSHGLDKHLGTAENELEKYIPKAIALRWTKFDCGLVGFTRSTEVFVVGQPRRLVRGGTRIGG